MSKDIQTSHPEIILTVFWGGLARGTCIQIHTADPLAESDAIQLTKVQAEAAALALIDWLVPTPPPPLKKTVAHYTQCALPMKFETGPAAEQFLVNHGWTCIHAGNWSHPDYAGALREIRNPYQGAFIIVETKEAPNA